MDLSHLTFKTKNHDFYNDGNKVNIVPSGSKPPQGGYKSKDWILRIKGYPNLPEKYFHIHNPNSNQIAA